MKASRKKPIHVMAKRGNGRWHPLGSFNLPYLPRIGDFIETEIEGIPEMFSVVSVIHPTQHTPCSAEVWAVHAGRSVEVTLQLIRKYK